MAGRRLVIYLQTNINKNESINFRTPRCVYLHLYFHFTTMLILNRKERNNKISADVRYTRSIAAILPFVEIPLRLLSE